MSAVVIWPSLPKLGMAKSPLDEVLLPLPILWACLKEEGLHDERVLVLRRLVTGR
jgi:hypothetical protein